VVVVPIKGSVNPAMAEMLLKILQEADRKGAAAVIIQLDIPGGLLTSTKDIVEGILSCKILVVVYVSPAGTQAS
jgi:membrane-bound serine protease (ClpP class)